MTSNLCPPIERSTFTEPERAAALRLIALALDEDLGDTGDITTQSLIPPSQTATVQIVSRAVGVLAGTPLIDLVLDEVASRYLLSAKPRCSLLQPDGALLSPGTVVADLSGSLASLLIAERTILNFLTHLCGVASLMFVGLAVHWLFATRFHPRDWRRRALAVVRFFVGERPT